jgi:hypothetical protein
MTDQAEPAFEDLGAGRARITLVRDTRTGPNLSEITWYHRADGTRVLDHTFVPAELNGQGLAAILTEAALTLARKDQVRIVPQCSYVARWLDRHPAWQDLVAS